MWMMSKSVMKEHVHYDEWRLKASWRPNTVLDLACTSDWTTNSKSGLWSPKVLPFLTIAFRIEPINRAENIDTWNWPSPRSSRSLGTIHRHIFLPTLQSSSSGLAVQAEGRDLTIHEQREVSDLRFLSWLRAEIAPWANGSRWSLGCYWRWQLT